MGIFNVAVIKGDGIGPDIMNEAIKIMGGIGEKFGHKFNFTDVLMGGIAIDKTGVPLPEETIEICKNSDAVLLGAIGGEKWDTLPGNQRPEAGLLGIRKALGLFANLRPTTINKTLIDSSPLKPEIIKDVDMMVVRELCGGIYFGDRTRGIDSESGEEYALDTEKYSGYEVKRIAKIAFEIAQKRSKKLCSVDKANILESSRFWRENVIDMSKSYKDVELSHMYVDNAAMQILRYPSQFDVIVTSNMFGDILSDEASMIGGSIGMAPSASLGENGCGLYEPIHGSAPDIAGKNIANPIAMILSCAMMLRYSFDLEAEAKCIEAAVDNILAQGYRTADIASKPQVDGEKILGTTEMGDIIMKEI